MPAATFHLVVANGLLEKWPASIRKFEIGEPSNTDAFRAGALGPDMGYLGGSSFLSDLAHYVRTGDLARALLTASKNENDVAFALGWVSHIIADVIVHPLVNDGVGRWANHDGPINYAEDPVSHLRLEMGIDGHYQHLLDIEKTKALYFEPQNPIDTALQSVYGSAVDPVVVLDCHQKTANRSRLALLAAGVIGDQLGNARDNSNTGWQEKLIFLLLKSVSLAVPKTWLFSLTHPLRPDMIFVESMIAAHSQIQERFFDAVNDHLESLPNYNLDLGLLEADSSDYELARQTRQQLSVADSSQSGR